MRNRLNKNNVIRILALLVFIVVSGVLIAQNRQFSKLTLHSPATLPVDM